MDKKIPVTRHAPAPRAFEKTIHRQEQLFLDAPLLDGSLDNLQEMVLILNKDRQIVFANLRFAEFAGLDDVTELYGLRPGEAVGCIYALADETPAGCGTSTFCRTCGAVNAILNSQKRGTDVQECSIIREDEDALNLRVRTTNLAIESEDFTMFAIENISHEKRREELERIFFHDITSIADAVHRLAKVMEVAPPEKQGDFRRWIYSATSRLIEEIVSHKVISTAERDELVCVVAGVPTVEFLYEMLSLFDGHPVAVNRALVFDENTADCVIETDRGLLSRVIVNMLKNALEATPPGGTVTVGCDLEDDVVKFRVHNVEVMRRDVASQVFRRSFSTKGDGRGLGTYSMKLIGERYLNGRVSFVSEAGKGTTFAAELPLRFDRQSVS